jgi:hypothetical protein
MIWDDFFEGVGFEMSEVLDAPDDDRCDMCGQPYDDHEYDCRLTSPPGKMKFGPNWGSGYGMSTNHGSCVLSSDNDVDPLDKLTKEQIAASKARIIEMLNGSGSLASTLSRHRR